MQVVRGAGVVALVTMMTVCCLVGPAGAAAQGDERWNIEAYGSMFLSPYETMEQGVAVGARVLLAPDVPRWLRIGVGGLQLMSRSERDGLVCNRLDPVPQVCYPERVEDRVMVRSYGVGAFPEIDLSWTVRVRGGVGVTINEVHAVSRGVESGGLGNLHTVPWGHMGAFTEGALLWTPSDRVPVDVLLGANANLIWFDSCQDHPNLFNPLCGLSTITELRLGMSYRIKM